MWHKANVTKFYFWCSSYYINYQLWHRLICRGFLRPSKEQIQTVFQLYVSFYTVETINYGTAVARVNLEIHDGTLQIVRSIKRIKISAECGWNYSFDSHIRPNRTNNTFVHRRSDTICANNIVQFFIFCFYFYFFFFFVNCSIRIFQLRVSYEFSAIFEIHRRCRNYFEICFELPPIPVFFSFY